MATMSRPASAHDDRPLLELADAEDGGLWLVDDDRRRHQAAAHAVIRDRERAALAGPPASARRRAPSATSAPSAPAMPARSSPPASRMTGTTSPRSPSAVAIPMSMRSLIRIAFVAPAAIGFRDGAQGVDAGRDEIGRQGQRQAAALEFRLARRAIGEHGRHVALEHVRDVRRRVQEAFDHVRRDAPSHRRMRHAPQARFDRFGRRAAASVADVAASSACCQHVLDGDAPALAAALDLVGAEAALGEQTAHGRAHRAAAARRRNPPAAVAPDGGCRDARARGRSRLVASRLRLAGAPAPRRARRRRPRRRRSPPARRRPATGLRPSPCRFRSRPAARARFAGSPTRLQPALNLRARALHLVGRQHDVDQFAHRSDARNAAHRRHDITDAGHHRIQAGAGCAGSERRAWRGARPAHRGRRRRARRAGPRSRRRSPR